MTDDSAPASHPPSRRDDVYRLMFDASLDGLILIDRTGTVVDVNPAIGKIDGYTREEAVGRLPPRFRDSHERPYYQSLLDRVLAGETVESEMFVPHKNGERRPVETRSVRILLDGEPHILVVVRDLSERIQHEGELRRSEDLYRAMFDASVDGLVVLNAAGEVVDVNPALLRVDGFARASLIGQFPPTYRAPHLRPLHTRFVNKVLERGSLETEASLLRANGTRYTAEMRSVRIEFRSEPHVLVIVRDISERRQRELALLRSEEQYRTVFDGMLDGLALIRRDGVVVDANQAMLDLSGFRREDLIGHLPPTYVGHPDRIAAHREYVRRVLADERVKLEFVFERTDGSHYHAEVRPIRVNYNDEPHVLLVIRDISEQKDQHAALAQSENRLRATVGTALDSIIAMNEAGEIIDFNPAAEACFGYTREEVTGRLLEDVVIPPEMRRRHREGLARYLATGVGPYIGTRIEVEAMRKDGSRLQTELSISVADGTRGRIFIGYLRDITEQKRAAEQASGLEAQLRQAQKMEAIGHLTGGIAHDFNNILTSILGYVALARDHSEPQNDERLKRYLERAERAGGRARDLIAQMMTFSRGRQGKREYADLGALVGESLSLLESSLPASVEIFSDVQAKLPHLLIDPVQFEQIVVNLCINARDAMNGSGTLTVGLREIFSHGRICAGCHEEFSGRFIELAVSDSGPGIDPNIIDRIFEPFFTTKDIGKGSGMGLSTVHGIVHDHAGHALVDSQPGDGATMRILLPVGEQIGEDTATNLKLPVDTDHAKLSGRVLVVDDNTEVGEYVGDLLESWGLAVRVVTDPLTARDLVLSRSEAFDLVITDQTMPRLSGLDLARAIGESVPDLPVMLYTGYSETVTEELALAAGAYAFLQKPLDSARLRKLVQEIVT